MKISFWVVLLVLGYFSSSWAKQVPLEAQIFRIAHSVNSSSKIDLNLRLPETCGQKIDFTMKNVDLKFNHGGGEIWLQTKIEKGPFIGVSYCKRQQLDLKFLKKRRSLADIDMELSFPSPSPKSEFELPPGEYSLNIDYSYRGTLVVDTDALSFIPNEGQWNPEFGFILKPLRSTF
ncbi:MAG: hypothetical protein AB7O96_19520 [Pseudobdellovibrionaceae bacterium]